MIYKTDATGIFRGKMSWYLHLTIKWLNKTLERIDRARTCNCDETSKIFYFSNWSISSPWQGKFLLPMFISRKVSTHQIQNYMFIWTFFLPPPFFFLPIFKVIIQNDGFHYTFSTSHTVTPSSSDRFHFSPTTIPFLITYSLLLILNSFFNSCLWFPSKFHDLHTNTHI